MIAHTLSTSGQVQPAAHWRTPWRRAFINAIRIDAITECQCVDAIIEALAGGRGGFVVTHNLDHFRRLQRDAQFASICASADLRVADGMPLVWIGRLLKLNIPERVAGSSLIHTLSAAAAERGRSVYLLGGDEGTAEASARILQERNPSLKIAGVHHAPFGFEKSPEQMAELIRRVTEASPDIVYVALGSPKQEVLIAQLRKHLPKTWWLGVGISFSYLAGRVRRAPRWVQAAGCEWLYRMMQEPRRLAQRYLVEGIPFAAWLLVRAFGDRMRGDRGTR